MNRIMSQAKQNQSKKPSVYKSIASSLLQRVISVDVFLLMNCIVMIPAKEAAYPFCSVPLHHVANKPKIQKLVYPPLTIAIVPS